MPPDVDVEIPPPLVPDPIPEVEPGPGDVLDPEPPAPPTTVPEPEEPVTGHQALDEWGQAQGLDAAARAVVGQTVEVACAGLRAGLPYGQVVATAGATLRTVLPPSLVHVAIEVGLGFVCPDAPR